MSMNLVKLIDILRVAIHNRQTFGVTSQNFLSYLSPRNLHKLIEKAINLSFSSLQFFKNRNLLQLTPQICKSWLQLEDGTI